MSYRVNMNLSVKCKPMQTACAVHIKSVKAKPHVYTPVSSPVHASMRVATHVHALDNFER
jgi:hypothetical protein